MLPLEEQELLKKLAYQSWVERGQPDGSPEIDWERAKAMLMAHRARGIESLDSAMGNGRSEATVQIVDSKLKKKPLQQSNRSSARAKSPQQD